VVYYNQKRGVIMKKALLLLLTAVLLLAACREIPQDEIDSYVPAPDDYEDVTTTTVSSQAVCDEPPPIELNIPIVEQQPASPRPQHTSPTVIAEPFTTSPAIDTEPAEPDDRAIYAEIPGKITIGFFNGDPTKLEFRAPAGGVEIGGWAFEQLRLQTLTGDIGRGSRGHLIGNASYNVEFVRVPTTNVWEPISSGSFYIGTAVFNSFIPEGAVIATLDITGIGEIHITGKFYIQGQDLAAIFDIRLSNESFGNFPSHNVTVPPTTNVEPTEPDDRAIYVEIPGRITIGFFNGDPTKLEFRAPTGGVGNGTNICDWSFNQLQVQALSGDIGHGSRGHLVGNEQYDVDFVRATGSNVWERFRGEFYHGAVTFTNLIFIPEGAVVGTLDITGIGEIHIMGVLVTTYNSQFSRVSLDIRLSNDFSNFTA
jgi:hypothetical protein